MANGILIVDKPAGWTSQDVAAKLRGVFHEKRVGHSGTLDPMATGVLVVFVGRATRAVEFAESDSKEYLAGLRLGLVSFRGEISQLPPMYSAIKIGGKKLYELARKGREVERKPRNITVYDLQVEQGSGADWLLHVECSKGTYVRTLCHDIGQALGCGGCMSSLRRARAGQFTLAQAVTMEQILEFAKEHDPAALLLPVDALFAQHPPLIVTLPQTQKLKNGAAVRDWHFADGTYRVYSETGEFLLLGTVKNQILTTVKSFFEV